MSDLSVTIIQPNLFWEDKEANLQMLESRIEAIEKTELVILPEMFTTGFSMAPEKLAEPMDGPAVNWMRKMAQQKRIILTGSLIIEEEGKYYNRLIWMLPNGESGFYNKRHLFAYAGEDQHYAPGNRRFIASVKGWKLNMQVCYDLRFPGWNRQQYFSSEQETATPEYDILVFVANWPERRNTAWKTLLQARAIENQCYVIGVNRVGDDGNGIYHSGDSMIIDPMGKIITHLEHHEATVTQVLSKTIVDETRTRFPFWKDADPFLIVT